MPILIRLFLVLFTGSAVGIVVYNVAEDICSNFLDKNPNSIKDWETTCTIFPYIIAIVITLAAILATYRCLSIVTSKNSSKED